MALAQLLKAQIRTLCFTQLFQTNGLAIKHGVHVTTVGIIPAQLSEQIACFFVLISIHHGDIATQIQRIIIQVA